MRRDLQRLWMMTNRNYMYFCGVFRRQSVIDKVYWNRGRELVTI